MAKTTKTTPEVPSRPTRRKAASSLIASPVAPSRARAKPAKAAPEATPEQVAAGGPEGDCTGVIRVRRMHRRDIKRVWEFLKRVFRDVNQKTVELQRARNRSRFEEVYDNEGIDQLVFEVDHRIVGYAESTFQVSGADNYTNWRWFESRDMRPLFVEELAVDTGYQGCGVGSFMLEQLRHIATLRGCTHLVLEVAENNEEALRFYRKRNFQKIDAAIFLAQKLERLPELLPPRPLKAPSKPVRSPAKAPRKSASAPEG
jgi:ribosomal protein S18 acetylase RimI-like enzyme